MTSVAWGVLALAPALVAIVLRAAAPVVLRQCGAALATRLLVALSLVAALGTGLALCGIAVLGVAQIPWAAREGRWSADAVSDRTPMPGAIGVAAGVTAVVLLSLALVHTVRATVRIWRAVRAGRGLGPGAGELVVVSDDIHAQAYALPGLPGRIVATTALMTLLDAEERRAVFAHERSHLRHVHALYVQLAELAAAANPLLRPVAGVVRAAVETWADNDAVAEVGDPLCVAQALAKVSLRQGAPLRDAVLAMADTEVSVRIRALLDPAPRHPRRWSAAAATAAALCTATSFAVALRAHWDVQSAQHLYWVVRHRH